MPSRSPIRNLIQPFDVSIHGVSDPDLGPLLAKLHADGFQPVVKVVADAVPIESAASTRGLNAAAPDLPGEWRLVRELDGQSYVWPKEREHYLRYRIFAGETQSSGTVHIALGEAPRAAAWGRERKYSIAFLASGAPQVPLVEFLEVDDYESSHELLAIIRGSDGGKKMYGPGDSLPAVYEQRFRTEIYNDRVIFPRSWSKMAVIAHEDDYPTMLNHALLQARRRGDL